MIAGLAIAWYVPLNILSENFLYDTITALSLMIAFYYALTGLACAVYYRRELTKSVKNFLFIGVGPLVGAAILGYLFVKSAIDFYDVENSYTGQSFLGMGVPFVIGMGVLAGRARPARAVASRGKRALLRSPARSSRWTPRWPRVGRSRVRLAAVSAPAADVDVRLEGVVKRFDEAVAVDGISLEVRVGRSSRCSVRPAAGRRRRCG